MPRSIFAGIVGHEENGFLDHCELEAVLDCIDTEKLATELSPSATRRGPKGYERESVVKSLMAMRRLGIPSVSALRHSNGNREPSSDPEASWRYCRKAGVKDGFEWVYGYGVQLVVDANYGLPLALRVTTGSRNDNPQFIPTMEEFESLNLDTRLVSADKGYDSKKNNRWLHALTSASASNSVDLPEPLGPTKTLNDGMASNFTSRRQR